MSALRSIYHLARADFFERTRRYSFLMMMVAVIFLGYQIAIGNMALTLGNYRGVFNSAWIGAMMTLNATLFIGWFGFYLVKGSIGRDRQTGVGQIMAATPITRPHYMIGKWLSNFSVLILMMVVLAFAGLIIQLLKGESSHIDIVPFIEPFLYIAIPLLALVAAVAILFEAIPFLKGGLGNIIYFIGFISSLPIFMENMQPGSFIFEPTGLALIEYNMRTLLQSMHSDYNGSFSLGSAPGVSVDALKTFIWPGMVWTADMILARMSFILSGAVIVLFGSLFFDRFDSQINTSKSLKIKKPKFADDITESESAATVSEKTIKHIHLTPLDAASNQYNFFSVLKAEIKLLLKGQYIWWYIVSAGLITACVLSPNSVTREILLPIAWSWPILIWSSLGNREIQNNVQQLTFTSISPVWRQLPAQWLAGFLISLIMGSGAFINFIIAGNAESLTALVSGAVFIPSLAMFLGVWSKTNKLFEIVYLSILYIGPFNKIPELDFIGTAGSGRPEFFMPLSAVLIVSAFYGRFRQVEKGNN